MIYCIAVDPSSFMSTTIKQYRYLEIAESLRNKIRNGDWASGERLPSFVEMYREHGATTNTMQKVYDLLEKEELIERRSRSGVYVSSTDRKRSRIGILAVMLPHYGEQGTVNYMDSAYSMRLLRGMHAEAADLGFQLTLGTLEQILASPHPVDGVLLQGESYFQQFTQLKKPVVSLITHLSGISSVGVDDFESCKEVTEYLLKLGHRRIGALMGSDDGSDRISPLRVRGYQAALTQNGIEPPAQWHRKLSEKNSGEYLQWGFEEMSRWLEDDWSSLKCTALIAQNDAVAVGAINALRQHGYSVPEDVSVVGFDNAGNDWHFDLKLTSVQVPLEEIGREAVALLNQRIDQPDAANKTVKFPTQIIVGDSTTNI